ncbi:DUF3443 family protein [Paraburkholderia aspalathi]|uniref:DUF3443 family protein n=1 Tax=Paraburkholderia sp. SEWSISQ10-3 4 TaxID=2937437 RepID=UPI0027E17CB7|nr:DUF3443 family protein [Paraburkholderia aspalathi]
MCRSRSSSTAHKPSHRIARREGLGNIGAAADLGANGVLGIRSMVRGFPRAAQYPLSATYYYCPSTGSCTNTRVPLDTQVMNPVANFTSDNNGTIIRLPALPADGQARVTGELVFGVGTQQNNALPSKANIVSLDQNGYFTTTYKGVSYSSTIDSGSNTTYFWDTAIPYWGTDRTGYMHTPSTTHSLSAILTGVVKGATPVTVPFSVANGWALTANQNAAYDNLATPYSGLFLWGLPFFFGRDVYTVLDGARAGSQTGPFAAF